MSTVSLTLPADGETIDASDVNNPLNTLAGAINGNLDSTNISSLNGSKILTGTLSTSALDAASSQGWIAVSSAFTYTGNNGNKEFTGTFPVDMTAVLSAGMKMRLTRSTTAPTQSMAFVAASSQLASKTSPTGISFTTAFTAEAWVYLNSYTSGDGGIISRDSGGATGGFALNTMNNGQLSVFWRNASGTTQIKSYQSLPLKKWTHVAAVVSSTGTASANLYINGQLVISFAAISGANSMLQAGNLEVGAYNGSANFFDGYISEARIWGVAQSGSSIQANMAISLTGSETNLVALFQGNGNFTDKTSNGNTLTATGAVATNASNPYNTIEYGYITKVGAFSASVTPITISTGDSCNIPNMALSSPAYSTDSAPFGLPSDLTNSIGRRLLYIPILSAQSTASTSVSSFNPVTSIPFTVPSNCSTIKIKVTNQSVNTGSASVAGAFSFYNGSISGAALASFNSTTVNGFLSAEALVSVVPGSTFNLTAGWLTANAGNPFTWGASVPSNAIWVESA